MKKYLAEFIGTFVLVLFGCGTAALSGGIGGCLLYTSQKRTVFVNGPIGGTVEAEYGILPDGTAVLEMAACAGLTLVGENKRPEEATTYRCV